MRTVNFSILGVLVILSATSLRAQSVPPVLELPTSQRVTVEIPPPDQLVAKGWAKEGEQVWKRVEDNGVEVVMRRGVAARDHLLAELADSISALQAIDKRTARQDIELLELLIRRDEVEQLDVAAKTLPEPICTGVATFDHWFTSSGFAYVSMDAQTTFIRDAPGPKATSWTRATIIDFNNFSTYEEWNDNDGMGVVVSSFAGIAVPTWSCMGWATGKVTLDGCSVTVDFASPPRYC